MTYCKHNDIKIEIYFSSIKFILVQLNLFVVFWISIMSRKAKLSQHNRKVEFDREQDHRHNRVLTVDRGLSEKPGTIFPHSKLVASLMRLEQNEIESANSLDRYSIELNSLPKNTTNRLYKESLTRLLQQLIPSLNEWITLRIEEDVDNLETWVEISEKLEESLRSIEIVPKKFPQICDSLGEIIDACNF